MNTEIDKIIQKSSFKIEEGRYIYAKVSEVLDMKNYFLVSRDVNEITVVTREENIAGLDIIERNKDDYRLIALNVSIPFYCVGFLATISQAIAEAGMNILIVSTYSKDYILVKAEAIDSAKSVLLRLGFKQTKE
ncbi:MAG TPA: ACT domain-containing protein [Patescibacteria group bacterium]|nr:ACT domain-containing protein [Patescibacteria group bacterium]